MGYKQCSVHISDKNNDIIVLSRTIPSRVDIEQEVLLYSAIGHYIYCDLIL